MPIQIQPIDFFKKRYKNKEMERQPSLSTDDVGITGIHMQIKWTSTFVRNLI